MLTVPEAARRVRCNPETVRRWIRSGRLPSRRAGTQHLIEESDLRALVPPGEMRLPAAWRRTATGEPMPNVVRAVRREAWRVAEELGWMKTYDAEYVALARLARCRLFTVDARLRRGAGHVVEMIGPGDL